MGHECSANSIARKDRGKRRGGLGLALSRAARAPRLSSVGLYAAAAALSLLILTVVLQLWRADLRVPFAYSGDAMFYHVIVKGMLDHGWYLDNPGLGLPAALDLRDVPTTDHNIFLLLLRLGAVFTRDFALLVNLFYLLTFPLAALAALYALRRVGLAAGPALAAGLLYAFLPFHFSRGQHHLFLAAYFVVPLILLAAIRVCEERLDLGRRGWLGSLALGALIGSTGSYYAFFGCFFLLVAGLTVAVRRRRLRPLAAPSLLAAVIMLVTALNLLPSVVRLAAHGDTPVVRRNPADADTYGLKIAQLLLPISGHRVYRVDQFKGVYNLRPHVNENDDASLGAIGGAGFLLLLGWFLYKKADLSRPAEAGAEGLLHHLSLLNAAGVLLATTGGFGSLIALLVSPKIRAYNRVSVFLAFFALGAVALALDLGARRYARGRWGRLAFGGLLALLLGAGVFDQTSRRHVPDYERLQAEYRSDAEFVRRVEAALPRGAGVFQLPVMSFPENPRLNRMSDYDLAKGSLHSRDLRWSYGAVKNREGDAWQRMVAARSAPELVETLALAGFGGVYLDRYGYADGGAKLESELCRETGAAAAESGNGRLAFFDLTRYGRELRARLSAAELAAKQEAARHPLLSLWENGFSEAEGAGGESWRWCASEGRLELVNGSPRSRRVKLEASFAAGREAELRIDGPLLSERLQIGVAARSFARTLILAPGRHTINFYCDAPRILAPLDARVIVFRVQNFRLTEE